MKKNGTRFKNRRKYEKEIESVWVKESFVVYIWARKSQRMTRITYEHIFVLDIFVTNLHNRLRFERGKAILPKLNELKKLVTDEEERKSIKTTS